MNIEKEVLELNLDEIIPNRFQPREKFNEQFLNELAASIKQHGVISPIIVRKIGDKYEIVAGERRFKASQIAGKTTIPAIVADLNDTKSAEVALIENVQRRDLTPIEEAKTYKNILTVGNITQGQLAERIGLNQSTVANKLRLLDLDETVQDALLNDKISERHARSLLTLSSKEDQKEFLNKIINNKMTVRETDLAIKEKVGINKPIQQDIEIISDEDESNGQSGGVPIAPINPVENRIINPFGDTNIEQIKEQAIDINVQEPLPNFNNLLKTESEIENKNITPVEPIVQTPENSAYKFFAPVEEEKNISTNDISNFGSTINNNSIMDQPINIEQPVVNVTAPINNIPSASSNQTFVSGDLRAAINTARQCVDTIEKYGFTVDSEEFDFEQMYQIIIKINKN